MNPAGITRELKASQFIGWLFCFKEFSSYDTLNSIH